MPEPFGKYQLLEKIAQGGMAEVFLASRDGEIGGFTRRLAIKRMFPHLVDQEEIITMFIDEARIAARLHHPNIVQIYDLGVVEESFFIAMEYVEGLDLRRLCELGVKKKNFIPRPLAVHIVCEVAAGLHYAHTRTDDEGRPMNIIHRDVSPQNVMISVDGAVKLCDFGIAKAESRLTHTQAGEFKGKFSYMSPEQFGHGTLDHRSDIFTLGIVLYEITVATRLFKARTEYETIRRITEGVVTTPSKIRPDFPSELERIIMKALEVNASDRYQSAEALHADLEEWLFDERVRAGTRQLASYLDELLDGPRRPQLALSAGARVHNDADDEESQVDSTIELSMTDADFMELEEAVQPDVTEFDDSTVVDSYSIPIDEDVPPADAVEIRRISPEEARMRRQNSDEVDSFDATLVEGEQPDGTTSPLDSEHSGEPAGASRQITNKWSGEKKQEDAEETGFDVAISATENDPLGDADEFIGDLPDLRIGGKSLGFENKRVVGQGALPTGPMEKIQPQPPTTKQITRLLGRNAKAVAIGGVALVLVTGLVLMVIVMAISSTEESGAEALASQEQEEVAERGQELVGEREVELSLQTEPPGAFVVVNGVLQSGTTPLSASLVDGRDNEVWIARRHHRPTRLLIPAQGDELERTVELERATGTRSARAHFRSTPGGAQVYINGEAIGKTPLRMENVRADFETHVQMELEGHRPFVAFLSLRTQGDNRINAVLPTEDNEEVSAHYNVTPRGSRILLSGEFVDNTPFEMTHHRDEWLAIELQGDRRQPRQHRLRLDKIGAFMLANELEVETQETGRVSIEVEPTAAIYVGTRAFGASPLKEAVLPKGEQTVVFETIEGRRIRVSLEVEAQAHRRYLVRLNGDEATVEELPNVDGDGDD